MYIVAFLHNPRVRRRNSPEPGPEGTRGPDDLGRCMHCLFASTRSRAG